MAAVTVQISKEILDNITAVGHRAELVFIVALRSVSSPYNDRNLSDRSLAAAELLTH